MILSRIDLRTMDPREVFNQAVNVNSALGQLWTIIQKTTGWIKAPDVFEEMRVNIPVIREIVAQIMQKLKDEHSSYIAVVTGPCVEQCSQNIAEILRILSSTSTPMSAAGTEQIPSMQRIRMAHKAPEIKELMGAVLRSITLLTNHNIVRQYAQSSPVEHSPAEHAGTNDIQLEDSPVENPQVDHAQLDELLSTIRRLLESREERLSSPELVQNFVRGTQNNNYGSGTQNIMTSGGTTFHGANARSYQAQTMIFGKDD
jgi:hypothetical protein